MSWKLHLLFLPVLSLAQTIPFRFDPINLIPPSANSDGSVVLFAAAMGPDGLAQKATNLFASTPAGLRQLTNFTGSATYAGVTSISQTRGFAAYAASLTAPGSTEEVHLIDTVNGADRTLAIDKEGCIQPLCIACARPCVGPVHLNSDATKVLYAVAREQPFFVVNADGTGLKRLPVYLGALRSNPVAIPHVCVLYHARNLPLPSSFVPDNRV